MAYPQQTKEQQNYPSQCQQLAPSAPSYAPPCSPPAQPVYPVVGLGYPQPAPGYSYLPPQGYYPLPSSGYPPIAQTYGPPITNQPATQGWMAMPQGLPACPLGLEYLSMIDQVLVQQKIEILEALTGFETKNKYIVKNNLGQKVYYAREDTACLPRCCCGSARPFHLKILDNYGNEIINMYRPLACSTCCCPTCPCCCPCSLESMEVSAPPGTIIGKIEEDCTFCSAKFSIKNASGETVLRIEGPICKMSICGDVKFKVLSSDGKTKVGLISKQWSGLAREALTDADFFGITFPMDLDVRMKAVMLGACFLLDIMYFEKNSRDERGGGCFADCLGGIFN